MKRSVLALLVLCSFAASAHGHHGGGHMGGHSFNNHSFNGHDFNGHNFNGRKAGNIDNGHTFNGFARGSINMGNTSRTVAVKDGAIVGTKTTTIGDVTRMESNVISADYRSHSVAVTNGTKTAVATGSYQDGMGGISVHGVKNGANTVGHISLYNDVANAAYRTSVVKNDEVTRVGVNVVSPTQRSHMVDVKSGDYSHIHTRGYIGNEEVGRGWNKSVTTEGQYGFERSVDDKGIATVAAYGPAHYGEIVANLKTGKYKAFSDITPPTPVPTPVPTPEPVPTPIVDPVVPVTPDTPSTPVAPVNPDTPVAPVNPVTPDMLVNAHISYVNADNDFVLYWWNV